AMAAKGALQDVFRQIAIAREMRAPRLLPIGEVAARQRLATGPRGAERGKIGRELLERVLRETAISGDFSAEDRKHGRRAAVVGDLQRVVARDRRGVRSAVVMERPYAGVAPENVLRRYGFREVATGGTAQILDFRLRRLRAMRRRFGHVGRPDQR